MRKNSLLLTLAIFTAAASSAAAAVVHGITPLPGAPALALAAGAALTAPAFTAPTSSAFALTAPLLAPQVEAARVAMNVAAENAADPGLVGYEATLALSAYYGAKNIYEARQDEHDAALPVNERVEAARLKMHRLFEVFQESTGFDEVLDEAAYHRAANEYRSLVGRADQPAQAAAAQAPNSTPQQPQ